MLWMSLSVLAAPLVAGEMPRLAEVERHLSHGDGGGRPGCLTGAVAELRGEWEAIPAEERAAITQRLAPWKADLFEPMQDPAQRDAPPPPWGTDTCWGQQMDNRIEGQRFAVEWEDGVDEDDARAFLEALEYSYDVEVDALGWNAPDGIQDYLMAAYITYDPRSGGAYTTIEQCGNVYMPYMVASSGSWSSPEWADTMAAHEFNHAIQFSYGFSWEFWYWEATATWMEENVYPASDEWYDYVTGYTDQPWIGMSESSQQDQSVFWHMYGMAIWAFHLDHHYGGQEMVRATWEAASDERGQYTFGMLDALPEQGLDMESVYLDFLVRNVVMDYDQRMPAVASVGTISALPGEGAATRGSLPGAYGQNYWDVRSGLGSGDLLLTFTGDAEASWAVGLVEYSGSTVLRSEVQVLSGDGEVRLTGYGDDDVAIVISPMTTRASDFEYSFTLELVESTGDDTGGGNGDDTGGGNGDDTGGDNGDDNGTDGDDTGGDFGLKIDEDGVSLAGSCACSSGGGGASVGALLLLGGLALRRRR